MGILEKACGERRARRISNEVERWPIPPRSRDAGCRDYCGHLQAPPMRLRAEANRDKPGLGYLTWTGAHISIAGVVVMRVGGSATTARNPGKCWAFEAILEGLWHFCDIAPRSPDVRFRRLHGRAQNSA